MSDPCQLPVPLKQEGVNTEPSDTLEEDTGSLRKPIILPEEEATIQLLLILPDKGVVEEQKYGRRFQLVHLSLFFLISNDAQNRKQQKLANYGHNYEHLLKVYNFRNDPTYKTMMDRGFTAEMYVSNETTHLVKHCRDHPDTFTKKQAIRALRFNHGLLEYMSKPFFKPFALEFVAYSHKLNVRDQVDSNRGIKREATGIRQLYWELFGWMFDYLAPRINRYLMQRVPGKQTASEKKFFQARKEHYMSLSFDSTKTALVAYCYHILTMFIQVHDYMEPNLMLLVFTDLRKLKVKLQGNAKELNQAAEKALEDAEYKILSKVLRLNQWESRFDIY